MNPTPGIGHEPRSGTWLAMRAHAVSSAVLTVVLAGLAASTLRSDVALLVTLIALAPVLAPIAVIDASTQVIPDPLVEVGLIVVTVSLLGASMAAHTASGLGLAVVAGLLVGTVYLALWRVTGLGLGDAKLAAVLALVAGWTGWQTVVAFIILSHLVVVPVVLWRLARGRRAPVAFGPALVAGLYGAEAITVLLR